ncbi:MAG: caspase domain-containing protein, partial [Betaproteobacteria bacterium]
RQRELEQKLALETQERERQAAEVEAVRQRQQELQAQLATLQSQGAPRPSQQTAVVRNAHALVIGNAAYPGSMRLSNPVNDANAISQKLRSLGFTVTTVTDLNRQRLVQAMTQFRRSAASADLSLLFYSGHGVQIFGTNYILPTDVDQSDVAQATIQGVSLSSVLENFLPGKTKLVFLDACRDNPLMKTGDRSVSVGLAPVSVAQGTLISYATKDGQTASDGVGARNSPFTTALLEHLGDPNDIAVVLRKVRERVMQATGGKQQPWEYGSLTGGELVLSRITAR